MEFLTEHRIPIGIWAKNCVDWLTQNGAWFFDQLSALLSKVINALLFLLQWPHALVIVALMTGLSFYLRRSIGLALFTCLGLLLIINQGYWKETTETLALVLAEAAVHMGAGDYGDEFHVAIRNEAGVSAEDTAAIAAAADEIDRASGRWRRGDAPPGGEM